MLHKILEQKLQQAVSAAFPDAANASILVRPCPDPKFGDYQTNALMGIAKARKMNPRQLATDVAAKLEVSQWCDKVDVAGAGFLNFRLKPSAIAAVLSDAAAGKHLFFEKSTEPRCVIIDFSSPNVAKPMHVGHIRSTILGDSLARVLRLLGHHVVTDNHIGDWGTQFGKLLVGWKSDLNKEALSADPIAEMERLYKLVNARCEADPSILEKAREETVKLQSGDAKNLEIWREMMRLSQVQFDRVYARLGVTFDYTLGESYYNPMLQNVVDDLMKLGVAQESKGAKVIFFSKNKEAEDEWANVSIVQKSDGGFNYTTTDLATLLFRWNGGTWSVRPNEIIYVTGAPQQQHFTNLFEIFRKWHPEAVVKLSHAWFGSVLGEDGKPFRTRDGDTVRLEALLNEAEERALKIVEEKQPELDAALKKEIARVVGIGAIKYADLAQNRQTDYIFSWDKLLAFQGNTAVYLLYAYTRVRSILRKGEEVGAKPGNIIINEPDELAVARHLLNFGMTLDAVVDDYRPNFLCSYLFELAGHLARYYENCPVLKAEGAIRSSRLALCELAGKVLKQGLEVLGIETTEQM